MKKYKQRTRKNRRYISVEDTTQLTIAPDTWYVLKNEETNRYGVCKYNSALNSLQSMDMSFEVGEVYKTAPGCSKEAALTVCRWVSRVTAKSWIEQIEAWEKEGE